MTSCIDDLTGRQAVRDFVLEINPDLDPADLHDDTPLIARRLVTSRHILDLLLLVESLRRAPIDPRSLAPSSFADIDSIVGTLLPRRAAMTATSAALRVLPNGVQERSDGSCLVFGSALRWLTALDAAILGFAAEWSATEYSFPPLIPAADLERIDYFRSFPQLVTMPVTLPADQPALERFIAAAAHQDGTVSVPEHAPIRHALTPAACYPVYPAFGAQQLDRARHITVKATCFRREAEFIPLRRQWTFTMREIVCIGTAAEVARFLDRGRRVVEILADRLDLGYRWQPATDPFFNPDLNGRALLQRLSPTKNEAVVDELAIASVNLHHDHFGDAFEIRRGTDRAHSGCVAFGLERWLGVVAGRWGSEPADWPDPRTQVRHV